MRERERERKCLNFSHLLISLRRRLLRMTWYSNEPHKSLSLLLYSAISSLLKRENAVGTKNAAMQAEQTFFLPFWSPICCFFSLWWSHNCGRQSRSSNRVCAYTSIEQVQSQRQKEMLLPPSLFPRWWWWCIHARQKRKKNDINRSRRSWWKERVGCHQLFFFQNVEGNIAVHFPLKPVSQKINRLEEKTKQKMNLMSCKRLHKHLQRKKFLTRSEIGCNPKIASEKEENIYRYLSLSSL